jgi:hypothetical protein
MGLASLAAMGVASVSLFLGVTVLTAKRLVKRDLAVDVDPTVDRVKFAEVVNSARSTLLQLGQGFFIALGALGTLGTLIFTAKSVDASRDSVDASWQAVQATRDGIITDLYTRAVEELSSPDRGVRIGGVYALERIASRSAADQPTIVAVLAVFLQDHRGKVGGAAGRDAQAAITVLARRDPKKDDARHPRINLDGVVVSQTEIPRAHFGDVILSNSDLGGVDFSDADLAKADVGDADLSGAILKRATLLQACLSETNLDGADLQGANLAHADLTKARLSDPKELARVDTAVAGADFTGAVLADADLRGVDLSKATGLTSGQLSYSRIDARTKLPPGIARASVKKKGKATQGGPCDR